MALKSGTGPSSDPSFEFEKGPFLHRPERRQGLAATTILAELRDGKGVRTDPTRRTCPRATRAFAMLAQETVTLKTSSSTQDTVRVW
jgi:hypothetical protein